MPDVAVGGMDVLAAAHGHLSERKGSGGDRRQGGRGETGPAAYAEHVPAGVFEPLLRQHRRVGGLEVLELRDGAADPISPAAASTRPSGTSRPWYWRSSTTRWVTAGTAGSTTTRATSPQAPSVQLTSAPIVNCAAAMASSPGSLDFNANAAPTGPYEPPTRPPASEISRAPDTPLPSWEAARVRPRPGGPAAVLRRGPLVYGAHPAGLELAP